MSGAPSSNGTLPASPLPVCCRSGLANASGAFRHGGSLCSCGPGIVGIGLVVAGGAHAQGAPGLLSAFGVIWKWFRCSCGASGSTSDLCAVHGLGTVAGLGLGLAAISQSAPLRQTAWGATQFFRNAPWLVLLFFCLFMIPFQFTILGKTIPFPDWVKAVIGFALPVMANMAEIVRGAVKSLPSGQWEAAESLAFSRRQTLWMIILRSA